MAGTVESTRAASSPAVGSGTIRALITRISSGAVVLALPIIAACSGDYEISEVEHLGVLKAANNCGPANYQDVETYNGSFGVPVDFVAERERSVGLGITDLGGCTGTLISRNLFLSAGHCEYQVGDEVVFNYQVGAIGSVVTHTVTVVVESKNNLSNPDPNKRFDYAVVRLNGAPGLEFGYSRLADEEARTVVPTQQILTAIGHPGLDGDSFKKVSTGPYVNASAPLVPNWFAAQIDMVQGSSGGAVFRRDGLIVGVHTTAGCGPSTGNHNMRMPVLLDESAILRQVIAMQGVHFANVNGTGGADAVIVNSAGIAARMSNGSSFGTSTNWTTNSHFGDIGTFFADVTGDGRADAIALNGGLFPSTIIRHSNGNSFSTNLEIGPVVGGTIGALKTAFADVTGDGRADAVSFTSNPNRVLVNRSNGIEFGATETWLTTGFMGGIDTIVADITGDGRADAIAIGDSIVTIRRSTGTGFGAAENWTSSRFFGAFGTFVADVTGDGRADLIAVNNGIVTVRRSTGSSFAANENWLLTSHFGSLGTAFVDVTGDGRADSIAVSPNGITVRPSTGNAFGASSTWVNSGYFGAM